MSVDNHTGHFFSPVLSVAQPVIDGIYTFGNSLIERISSATSHVFAEIYELFANIFSYFNRLQDPIQMPRVAFEPLNPIDEIQMGHLHKRLHLLQTTPAWRLMTTNLTETPAAMTYSFLTQFVSSYKHSIELNAKHGIPLRRLTNQEALAVVAQPLKLGSIKLLADLSIGLWHAPGEQDKSILLLQFIEALKILQQTDAAEAAKLKCLNLHKIFEFLSSKGNAFNHGGGLQADPCQNGLLSMISLCMEGKMCINNFTSNLGCIFEDLNAVLQ